MNILSNKFLKNGSIIHGECVMIDRRGNVLPCIDNLYHPNPGTELDEYSEIERTIDWLYMHDIPQIRDDLDSWIRCRVAKQVFVDPSEKIEDVTLDVMYSDIYTPCNKVIAIIKHTYMECLNDASYIKRYLSVDELQISKKIASFLNENFLRVRAGGKLNPCGTDPIYFRISSHGFDWRGIISEFLFDVFGAIENMPSYIWVGHDAETNPPEIILFDGSPDDFFNRYDAKIMESNDIVWM